MRMLALLLLTIAAVAQSLMQGDWKALQGAVIRLEPCATDRQLFCLRLVQLPLDAPEQTDTHNPDVTLRGRALCGLVIGSGFRGTDAAHLSGGHLYDPQTGHTYQGSITLAGDALKLRGYIGLSVFGRSETWHLAGAGGGVCKGKR